MTVCHLNLVNNTGSYLEPRKPHGQSRAETQPLMASKKMKVLTGIRGNEGNLNFMVVYNALDFV